MASGAHLHEGGPSESEPDWSEEKAELAAVLASKNFARAPALARILNYICLEYFQGRADAIKEYNIAVEALGRRPQFSPADDSIVRVEISRIRKRIQQYYAAEGATHQIRMLIPEIGYRIQFVRQEATPEVVSLPQQPEPQQLTSAIPPDFPAVNPDQSPGVFRGRRNLILLAAGILLLCMLVLGVSSWFRDRSQTMAAVAATAPATPNFELAGVVAGPREQTLRIAAGSSQPKFADRAGQVWLGDCFFTGGEILTYDGLRILRTSDPAIYSKARVGNFQYDIPLKPGTYELHLHFAEIGVREGRDSGGEGFRRFNVKLNGRPLLQDFDIALDAPGVLTADEKVFTDVSPARDGYLHLQFQGFMNRALLNGIEVFASGAHQVLPVRILAGQRTFYDHAAHFWESDRFFQGGQVLTRAISLNAQDADLFAGERFGNFSYSIPVAAGGRYAVNLRFAESNFGVDNIGTAGRSGGPGSRVFDVYCNGVAILRNFDILKEAGGPNLGIVKTIHGLKPNAQGKLVLSFVPVVDYATVRSIEVMDESR